MTTLASLETPCLILDRGRLERNAARVTGRYAGTGVKLRPHMKTAKSIDVARIALAGNFGGITVSTLKEAEYFADHGIDDITCAVGMVPEKLPRVARLIRRGVRLSAITDSRAMAEAISRAAVAEGVVVDLLIELDSGERRGGLIAGSAEVVDLGRALHDLPGTRLAGVLTHAGNSYHCRSLEELHQVAEEERLTAVTAADQLRAAGLPCPVVSAGSTPTAMHGLNFDGLTEMRCGVYMFGDLFQAQIGTHGMADIAVTVLSAVTGRKPDRNAILIDAGAIALSKDRSTEKAPKDYGFGLMLDLDGKPSFGEAIVARTHQEHGEVHGDGPLPFDRLPVGALVRIAPNHTCLTVAAHDRYHVVDGGREVIAVWDRVNGW